MAHTLSTIIQHKYTQERVETLAIYAIVTLRSVQVHLRLCVYVQGVSH